MFRGMWGLQENIFLGEGHRFHFLLRIRFFVPGILGLQTFQVFDLL